MKILPPLPHLPTTPVIRNHKPKLTTEYQAYRACLRWDFGFSCAFCLIHEADIAPLGAEGLGITTIEHFIPVSCDKNKRNIYENLMYACRFCNQSRSNKPISQGRDNLLNPTQEAWGNHFSWDDERIVPKSSNNSQYTIDTYDLNDPRKIAIRKHRKEFITDRLVLLQKGPEKEKKLTELAKKQKNAKDALLLLQAAKDIRFLINYAIRDLEKVKAVPTDSDISCRCNFKKELQLPEHIGGCLLEL